MVILKLAGRVLLVPLWFIISIIGAGVKLLVDMVAIAKKILGLCPCEDNAGVGSKIYKGTVFKAGKAYFLPVLKYPALVLLYFQSRKR